MAKIRPFKAVRPHRDKAHLVASRSYVTYGEEELNEKLNDNPYTFLHIIRPEMVASVRKSMKRKERFHLVREGYNYFRNMGLLKKDEEPAYYVYRQTNSVDSFTGVIAGVAVEEYSGGNVKIHEETITKREKIFHEYLEITGFNAEPVLLAYEDRDEINQIVSQITNDRPEYEFYTTDKVKHEMWLLQNREVQTWLEIEMENVESLYIADGHHRSASSSLVSQIHGGETSAPHNSFMSLLMPKSQLKIYDYNRLVHDLNGMTSADFIEKLRDSFIVEQHMDVYKPNSLHNLSCYVDNTWYSLTVRPEKIGDGLIDKLDSRILTNLVLKPLLDIQDLKTDDRIDFMNGRVGMRGLETAVDSGGFVAAFALYPVTFEQLKEVSDAKEIMPPKSTWIEPKLRSGMTIYELFED